MIQSNEREEYEFILGQNGQKEYFVKLIGEPYCRCKYVSKETILNSPNGEKLITRYLHSANHKTSPPFYDECYDIPDHIIQKKENLYLVKWTHLFYDQLTWEKKPDKQLLSTFRSRKSSNFPQTRLPSNEISLDNSFLPVEKFALYQDFNTPFDVVEEVQFLCTAVQTDDVTISEVDYNQKSIFSTASFIHYLYQKMLDTGPYLIVVDKREFDEWYDFLNRSKELTTLAYNGTVQSRKTIREIDFISEDESTLYFHILITIPNILEADINYLQQIEWKYCFFHYLCDTPNIFSNCMNNLQQLKILRKIIYQPIDQKTIIPRAQAINTAFETSIFKESFNTKSCEDFIQFIQKSKISSTKKVESTYFYIVECPMSDIQKKVCRYLLSENICLESPEKSNFFIIARLFYYVIQHPFIIPGIESKLINESVLLASTKMRVMRRIIYDAQLEIEESGNLQSILICTQIPEMFRIINDFLDDTYPEESNIRAFLETDAKPLNNLSLFSSLTNLNTNTQSSFKYIDIIIIFDGKLKHWEKMLDSKISQSSRIYKLESLDSREIEIGKEPSPTDQDICKTIALQIMIPTGKISPREILEANISFDMINDDQHSSSFAVSSFTGEDFWQKFVKTSEFTKFKMILNSNKPRQNINTHVELNASNNGNTNSNSKKKYQKNQKNQKKQAQTQNVVNNEDQINVVTISLYQRRQFVRSLISFGWGKWDKIINSVGFELSEETCRKICLNIFILLKYEKAKTKYNKNKKIKNDKKASPELNFVSNFYRDFLLQIKTDNAAYPKASGLNPNNFKEMLRNDKAFITDELPFDFFERIFQLDCLNHFFESNLYDQNDINNFNLIPFQSSKPESWWTEEHDKALLYGIWKHGYGNYISFMMNDNTEYFQEEEAETDTDIRINFGSYEKLLKEIAISNVSFNALNKRGLELLSFITSFIMNDLSRRSNNLTKTLPNWTDEEQEMVISYILTNGLNFNSNKEINEIVSKMVIDENGDQNTIETKNQDENQNENKEQENPHEEEEEEAKIESEDIKIEKENQNEIENQNQNEKENLTEKENFNEEDKINDNCQIPNKTKEEIVELFQIIRREILHPNPDEGGLSYFTALRIRIRGLVMRFLHEYVSHINSNSLFYFYNHIPKLIIGSYYFSPELEHEFLLEIENKGFGDFQSVLSVQAFSKITDLQFLAYMKDEYRVILRMNTLSQIAVREGLFSNEQLASDEEFEKLFGLTLPLNISPSCTVHSFGKIAPNKPSFHTERYIYPIGFKSSRQSPSITNPGVKAKWFSEIINVEDTPLFRVWQEGSSDIFFEGPTPTAAWVKALKASKHDSNPSISGPDSFLLTNHIVAYFIQKMPGASACKNYIMKKYDDDPIVVQFLKLNSVQGSNNDEGSDNNN